MPADGVVQLSVDGAGKRVDTSELTVSSNTVERQRINISDPTAAAAHAAVLNTQPAGTEYGLGIRPVSSFPDTTTGSTALGGLNQVISIPLSGQVGCGFQLQAAGTLVGTIVGEISIDGGTTWFSTFMEIPGTSTVISSANIASAQAASQWTVIPAAGASHARIRVSVYTSGSANFVARAAQILDETDEDAGPPGSVMPPIVVAQGAKDPGGLLQACQTSTLLPTGSEQGLIIRPAGGPPDLSTAPANFTSANNGTSFAIPGYAGASLNITGSAATFVFKAQLSTDGGTTWSDTYLQNVAGVTASTFAANGQYTILVIPGTSHVRTVLNSITSGTFTYSYRATEAVETDPAFAGPTGSAVSPVAAFVGASDGANLQGLRSTTTSADAVTAVNSLLDAAQGYGYNGATWDRLRTAASSGTGLGVLQTQSVTNSPKSWATYSASKAAGAAAASCTDVATIAGNTTLTIYVTRFTFSATIATAAVLGTVALIKRSAADTGGTSSTTTAVPHNAASAAATGSCLFYTVNPTGLGASIGNVRTWRYWFQLAATATTTPLVLDYTFPNPIALTGTAQQLACNLTTSANASVVDVTFEWFEA